MLTRAFASLLVVVPMGGCADIDDFINRPAPVVAHLEVFNRTESDLFYVAADGERLDVPACGRASDSSFRIDNVRVRTEDGYVRGFGSGVPEYAGRHVFVIEVASAADSGVPTIGPPPNSLPPCTGRPEVQVGI